MESTFNVTGIVVDDQGLIASNIDVKILIVRGDSEQPAAEGQTNPNGEYDVSVDLEIVSPPIESDYGIIVELTYGEEEKQRSPLIKNPKKVEIVNMAISEEETSFIQYPYIQSKLTNIPLQQLLDSNSTEKAAAIAIDYDLDLQNVKNYIITISIINEIETTSEIPSFTSNEQEVVFALASYLDSENASAIYYTTEDEGDEIIKYAVKESLISENSANSLTSVIQKFHDYIGFYTITQGVNENHEVQKLFEITGIGLEGKGEELIKAIADFGTNGNFDEFINYLSESEELFTEQEIEDVTNFAKLQALTSNSDLTQKLFIASAGDIDSYLIDADKASILTEIEETEFITPIPENISGDTTAEKHANYATIIYNKIEDAYPLEVIFNRAGKNGKIKTEPETFDKFLTKNNGLAEDIRFDILTEKIDKFVSEHSEVLSGMENENEKDDFLNDVRTIQRLIAVVPENERFEYIGELLSSNFSSAYKIKIMGRTGFANATSGNEYIDEQKAFLIYNKASQQVASALNLRATFGAEFNLANISALPNFELTSPVAGFPDIQNHFGHTSYCSCRHCRSVFSAAAYLVDLLNWLKNVNIEGLNLFTVVLNVRRPEIENILLNCENTNTVMPYIDLVNEVLENFLDTGDSSDLNFNRQTTFDTPILKANPEHVRNSAYELLKKQIYPWTAPFNLWEEQAHVFLSHFDVSLSDIISSSPQNNISDGYTLSNLKFLNINNLEYDILKLAYSDIESKTELQNVNLKSLYDGKTTNNLKHIRTFLDTAGITFEQYYDFLEFSFISKKPSDITLDGECNIDNAELNLTTNDLKVFVAYYRLKEKLGWSTVELDMATIFIVDAYSSLSTAKVNDDLINEITNWQRIHSQYRISVLELATWFGNISTTEYYNKPSQWSSIFLNPAVNTKNDIVSGTQLTIEELFEIDGGGQTANLVSLVSEKSAREIVLSAVSLSEKDFKILEDDLTGSKETTVENLSYLYRVSSFCKTLRISVEEFITMIEITGINPVSKPNEIHFAHETIDFIKALASHRNAKISIEELNYFLRNTVRPNAQIEFSESDAEDLLGKIRNELIEANEELKITGDNAREVNVQKLQLFVGVSINSGEPMTQDDIDTVISIIDKTTPIDSSDWATELNDILVDVYENKGSDIVAVIEGTNEVDERYEILFESGTEMPELDKKIDELLWPKTRLRIIVENFSNFFAVNTNKIYDLISKYVLAKNMDSDPILDLMVSKEFISDNPAGLVKGIIVLQKICLFIKKFKYRDNDLQYLFLPDDTEMYNLNTIDNGTYTAVDYPKWQKIIDISLVSGRFAGPKSLLEILTDGIQDSNQGSSDTISLIEDLMNWDDLAYLAGPQGFDFADGDANYYQKPDWVIKTQEVFRLVKKTGVGAETLESWVVEDIKMEQSTSVLNAIKISYENDRWLSIVEPLRDKLRMKQRDALADYIIKNPPQEMEVKTRDDLFNYFLIDTEVAPCSLTSRIVQANATIQTFVQRLILNLEVWGSSNPVELGLPQPYVEEWQWRKLYRVWEANRKVFLYPENWIEPDLRDDISPFFKELIDDVLQRDVTDNNAADAFAEYINKVDQVAGLDIVQLCYEQTQGDYGIIDTPTLHVFARTKSTPNIYFHRMWVDDAYWTHWENMNLEMEGDNIVPIVQNNRLFIFWASIIEKGSAGDFSPDDNAKAPVYNLEIYLNWCERKDGVWKNQKRSKSFLKVDGLKEIDFNGRLAASLNNENEIEILLYYIKSEKDNKNNVYAHNEKFRFGGCNSEPEVGETRKDTRIRTPFEKYKAQKWLLEKSSDLIITASLDYNFTDLMVPNKLNFADETPIPFVHTYKLLENIPFDARFSYTNNIEGPIFSRVNSNTHFFYEDKGRTFFVKPNAEKQKLKNFALVGLSKVIGDVIPVNPIKINPNPIVLQNPSKPNLELLSGNKTRRHRGFYSRRDSNNVIINNNDMEVVYTSSAAPATPIFAISSKYLNYKYNFYGFNHDYLCLFVKQLNRFGISGLFEPKPGRTPEDSMLNRQSVSVEYFQNKYNPTNVVKTPYPKSDIDFTLGSGFSLYNWELFFHAPFFIACELSKNQKFEDAQKWFHYIFDPTISEGNAPERFWRTKPFYEFNGESAINRLLAMLNDGNEDMQKQVNVWRKNPFMPHAIARLRWSAYMKNVLMKYLDNLIDWGDSLFRQDTLESVNEATQIYLLASKILGQRPEMVNAKEPEPKSFNSLGPALDDFSNDVVALEDAVPATYLEYEVGNDNISIIDQMYFCIPYNDKLIGYWDTVADRLFKIRNCMNIEGVFRQLPLFQPPIDPAMLVKAAAAGLSIADALGEMNAPMPYYRYQYLSQKAMELVGEVKSLGNTLLSVLEKKDAEELSLLRANHEVSVLNEMEVIRKQAIEETESNIDALKGTLEVIKHRRNYYQSREYLNAYESGQLNLLYTSSILSIGASVLDVISLSVQGVPQFLVGANGIASPLAASEFGGKQFSKPLQVSSLIVRSLANELSSIGNISGIIGGFKRREDDWEFQAQSAELETTQTEKQILAAEIRKAMAEKELENQELQIRNAEESKTFMEDKFTNVQLYRWMVNEVSKLYFNAYKMAYDMAKKAEKAYKYEIGVDDNNQYIKFGYWDSLKKGLLAGERLHQDLKRLDNAHTDRNRREYELTKQYSLALFDPQALVNLQQQGLAYFNIPEILYDLDHPGNYMRRIKSVTITIPCITGPYTKVNAKLTLLGNRIRKNNSLYNGNYPIDNSNDLDPRFIFNISGIDSIATSSGQNDSGLFELNFNDSRYLPFEGAGAISDWRIEFPNNLSDANIEEFRQFDFSTISDVILTINYTARDGGSILRNKAQENIDININKVLNELADTDEGLWRVVSLKREFPTEYFKFLNNGNEGVYSSEIELKTKHFPYIFKDKDIKSGNVVAVIVPKKGSVSGLGDDSLKIQYDSGGNFVPFQDSGEQSAFDIDVNWGDAGTLTADNQNGIDPKTTWRFVVDKINNDTTKINDEDLFDDDNLNSDLFEDILIAINYKKENN